MPFTGSQNKNRNKREKGRCKIAAALSENKIIFLFSLVEEVASIVLIRKSKLSFFFFFGGRSWYGDV